MPKLFGYRFGHWEKGFPAYLGGTIHKKNPSKLRKEGDFYGEKQSVTPALRWPGRTGLWHKRVNRRKIPV